jgi:hypothetical protein
MGVASKDCNIYLVAQIFEGAIINPIVTIFVRD